MSRPLLIGQTVSSGRATPPASTEARRAPAPAQRVQGRPDGEHALVLHRDPPRTATAVGALASVARDGLTGARHAAQRSSIKGGPVAASRRLVAVVLAVVNGQERLRRGVVEGASDNRAL